MYFFRKFFNYATLVLAITTIITVILVVCHKLNAVVSVIFMAVTLMFNSISRVYNDREIKLTKQDRELININKEKNDKDKENNKNNEKEKDEKIAKE